AFIFRSFIVKSMDQDFARRFFEKVLRYGAEHGYSGDARGMDFQVARLYSNFVQADRAFAVSIPDELSRGGETAQLKFLLGELRGFYLRSNLYAKARDKGFASYAEV